MAIILKPSPPPDPVKLAKRIRLDNYILLDTHKWSDAEEVDSLSEHVFNIIEPQLGDYRGNNVFTCLKVVLLNLFLANIADNTRYIGYHRSKDYESYIIYVKKSIKNRYNRLGIGITPLLKVMDALTESTLIEHEVGHTDFKSPGHGDVSKITALDPLLVMFKQFGITIRMIGISPKVELIELRGKKIDKQGNKITAELKQYKDTATILKMRANLLRFNNVLAESKILLKINDAEWLSLGERLATQEDKTPIEGV
jgi:hypothetical protein